MSTVRQQVEVLRAMGYEDARKLLCANVPGERKLNSDERRALRRAAKYALGEGGSSGSYAPTRNVSASTGGGLREGRVLDDMVVYTVDANGKRVRKTPLATPERIAADERRRQARRGRG